MKIKFNFTSDGVHGNFTPSEQENIITTIYDKFSDFQHGLLNEFDKFHRCARWVEITKFDDLFVIDSFVRNMHKVSHTAFSTDADHNLVMYIGRNNNA